MQEIQVTLQFFKASGFQGHLKKCFYIGSRGVCTQFQVFVVFPFGQGVRHQQTNSNLYTTKYYTTYYTSSVEESSATFSH